MRHTLTIAAAITVLTLSLAACSSSDTGSPAPATSSTSAAVKTSAPAADTAGAASEAFETVSAAVPAAKLTTTVTASNDPNHLLGRPHQYTSKITFTDSRINTDDVSGLKKDDALRGGAIEVFGTEADAQARADYIQNVTKSLPILAEYDFVHGPVLVRVSHYLTPAQAGEYDKAAADLG